MIDCAIDLTRDEFSLKFNQSLPLKSTSAIVGRSGIGKSTILRIIAGLEHLDGQSIVCAGNVLQDKVNFVLPEHRPLVYLGQSTALLPFLSARKNILFSYKRRKQVDYKALDYQHLAALFKVDYCLERKSTELSSGEGQRIALIAALVNCPQILLLDEAVSAIDSENKQAILLFLKQYCQERAITLIVVSHDDEEIALLEPRKIISLS